MVGSGWWTVVGGWWVVGGRGGLRVVGVVADESALVNNDISGTPSRWL